MKWTHAQKYTLHYISYVEFYVIHFKSTAIPLDIGKATNQIFHDCVKLPRKVYKHVMKASSKLSVQDSACLTLPTNGCLPWALCSANEVRTRKGMGLSFLPPGCPILILPHCWSKRYRTAWLYMPILDWNTDSSAIFLGMVFVGRWIMCYQSKFMLSSNFPYAYSAETTMIL